MFVIQFLMVIGWYDLIRNQFSDIFICNSHVEFSKSTPEIISIKCHPKFKNWTEQPLALTKYPLLKAFYNWL